MFATPKRQLSDAELLSGGYVEEARLLTINTL
jgi:hypothetical protein